MTSKTLPGDTIAAELARFVTGLRYEDLPAGVIASAKSLILDQFACQLVGSTVPWVRPVVDLVNLTRGVKAESTVVNHGRSFLAADAALANATFGQACEFDDIAYGSNGHIGAATVPVALAVGESQAIDGKQFLLSIVAGYEIMYRLMLAIRPYHNVRGFHSQSIAGPFAGAAVAGLILGLDYERMVHALAIAGSHASGTTEYDLSGGEVKRFHAGLAARAGVHSAQLAQFGLTGPPTIIEGKRGFCSIFATQSDPSQITAGLGGKLMIPNITFKIYPAVGANHSPIAATEHLVAKHDIKPGDVVGVRVGLAENAVLHGSGARAPGDVLGAQFSLPYSVALAIAKRSNDLAHYMDRALWSDPEIVGLMSRVEAFAHPDAHGETDHLAAVAIKLKDGRIVERVEKHMKGTPRNPASKEQLARKIASLSGAVLSRGRIEALIRAIDGLEDIKDVRRLGELLIRENA